MPDDKTLPMVRLQDGSIDYRYYAARASIARNRELKMLSGGLLAAPRTTGRALPVVFTLVLLVLVF